MLLNSTRRSETLSGQESTGVESEVFRTEEKLLQKKHTQKISDLAFYVTLCSQLWSKG